MVRLTPGSKQPLVLVTAALTTSVLLSGCLVVGHTYGSPLWNDPGLYRELADNGMRHGFSPVMGSGDQPDSVSIDGAPWGLSFHDEGLSKTWGNGTYALSFVRHNPDGDDRLVFQFDSESVMAWAAGGVEPQEVREAAIGFIENTTDLAGDERQELVETLMESRTTWANPPIWASGAGHHHVVSYTGDHRIEALFKELGGFENFKPENTARPVGLLPHFAYVTLHSDGWAYHFDVAVIGVQREVDGRVERLWVSPDDTAAFVVRTEREQSKAELREHLEQALADLGRDVPATDHWTFDHMELRETLWGD